MKSDEIYAAWYWMSNSDFTERYVGACRRCSNYVFILDLTPGFIGLGKDNCKTRRETFKFGDLVRLILDILGYMTGYYGNSPNNSHQAIYTSS